MEFFNYIARNSADIDLRVIYMSTMTPDRLWKMPVIEHKHKIFKGAYLKGVLYNFDILEILKEFKEPDTVYILGVYGNFTAQVIMRYLNFTGKIWLFWGEKPRISLSFLKKMVLAPLHGAKAILGIGSVAARVYEELLDKPIYNLPYFENLDRYLNINRNASIDGKIRFLYSGSLIERKGLVTLIGAFVEIRKRHENVELHLIGDGDLRNHLRNLIPDDLLGSVKFHGFVSWDALPKYYSDADVFVFPTRYDGWGLVLNEALASAMPIITTYSAGAAYDLIQDDRNGFRVPRDNSKLLGERMEYLINNPKRLADMGAASRDIAYSLTLGCGLQRLESILSDLLGKTISTPRIEVLP